MTAVFYFATGPLRLIHILFHSNVAGYDPLLVGELVPQVAVGVFGGSPDGDGVPLVVAGLDGRVAVGRGVGGGGAGAVHRADGGLHVRLLSGHALGHRAHVQDCLGWVDAEGVIGAHAHVAYGHARRLRRGGQAEHQAEG